MNNNIIDMGIKEKHYRSVLEDVDTVLVLDESNINEKRDERLDILPNASQRNWAMAPEYLKQGWFMNPYDNFSLGNYVRSGLSLGNKYGVGVYDFGNAIMVEITYYDIGTCKTSGAKFLIQIGNKNGKGVVRSSSSKFRTISNIGEAISYIRSRANYLSGRTGYND